MAKNNVGSVSKKSKLNRNQIRDLLSEQISRAIESRGFVELIFKTLDEIPDPKHKLQYMLELMQFVVPKLASQRIEVESAEAPVTHIVFQPASLSAVEQSEK
ncbi:MAG: hypothetical protein EOP06_02360 [Proteobacteria bacterium]|nr:MAG: hypothetical protein EOP06_02360 [Pseudomonadota bacterium]